MSQNNILRMFEKKKEPLTSKELSEYLKIRQETIIKTLKKLVEQKELKSRHLTKQELEKKGYVKKDIVSKLNSRFRIFYMNK
jgi:Mn-dependent DtxR family transcriptional regulator